MVASWLNRVVNCLLLAIVLLVSSASLSAHALAASTPALVIDEGFVKAPMEGSMAVLRDAGDALDLNEIAFGAAAERFEPIPGALAAGYTPDTFWVRLPVAVEGPAPALMLDMRPAFLDSVQVFVPKHANPSAASDYVETTAGDHTAFSERETISPSMVIPLALPADFSGYIYIRVKTSSTLALRGALRTPADMVSSATAQSLLLGLYQGIFLITGIANLMFWARLRDRTYLIYAVFILNCAALAWCKSGLIPTEWMPGGATGVDTLMGLMMFGSHGIGAIFASEQVNARRLFPKVHLVFLGVVALSVFGIIMTLLGHYQATIGPATIAVIPVALLALACNLLLVRRRVPGSVLAATAIAFQVAGVLVGSLMLNANIPYAGWMDYGFETGSVFFIIYMTLSLAQRAHNAEAERRVALAEALAVAHSAEQYALDLVVRRTGELAAAKDEAEAALAAEHESQLQQIRFVDVISHQYRTPLAVISSSLTALRLDLAETGEKSRDRIDRARRAIERLVEIIEVNGHRSRLQGVAAKAVRAPVALEPFIERLVAHAGALFPDRTISLKHSDTARASLADIDDEMTELALINLIENADKFSPPGLPISISFALHDGVLDIAVSDQGIGIPAEEQGLLTHKFFRASNSGGTSGLGLGLHIVKSAAAAHGGDVFIDSVEGEGTTVRMRVASR